MARTMPALCSGLNERSDCGLISPSTLMAGGKPAVQVGAFLLHHAPQQILH